MSEYDQPLVLPNDEFNQQLVANVHPADWVNPEPTGRYNIVVVGAGTAGLITAVVAASLGAKVALIEKLLIQSGRRVWRSSSTSLFMPLRIGLMTSATALGRLMKV